MKVRETNLQIASICHSDDPLAAASVADGRGPGRSSNRFVVSESDPEFCQCEIGLVEDGTETQRRQLGSIFEFRRRSFEGASSFDVACLVPTGIGSEIGGHTGGATPVARVIGAACDKLILHTYVVTASVLNEMPENAL